MMVGIKKEEWKKQSKKNFFTFDRFFTTDTEGSGVLCALESKNCDCYNGVLTTGLGIRTFYDDYNNTMFLYSGGSEIRQVQYIRKNTGGDVTKSVAILHKNNILVVYDLERSEFVKTYTFGKNVRMMDFVDRYLEYKKIFFGEEGVYSYAEEYGMELVYEGNVAAACVCKDRIFLGVKPHKILYFAPGYDIKKANTIDDNGEIFCFSKKGDIVGMQVLDNSVYVFFEYGIFRLNVAGAARDFVWEEVAYSGGKIFANSFGVVKGKICFLAENGVYLFDGKQAVKGYDALKITPKPEQDCSTAVLQDKLILRYVDKGGTKKTVVLEDNGMRGYEIFDLLGLHGYEGIAFCQRGGSLQYMSPNGALPSVESYRFLTKKLGFSSEKEKTLRSLRFEGSGKIKVNVISDRKKRSFELDMSSGSVGLGVCMKGRFFQFEFLLTKEATLTKMVVETEQLQRG